MCHNNSGDSACASLIPPDPVSCEWFKNGKRRRAESNIVYSSVGLPAYVNFRVFVGYDCFYIINRYLILWSFCLKFLPMFKRDAIGFLVIVLGYREIEGADDGMLGQVDRLFVRFVSLRL